MKLGHFLLFQECFTKYWPVHKKAHAPYDPWPGYRYTGPLRPYPLSAKRVVPPHIPRPDYADHPEGHPLSEIAARGSPVKVLSDEEIEGMKVVCKVSSSTEQFQWTRANVLLG